jgi:hypothetical protein
MDDLQQLQDQWQKYSAPESGDIRSKNAKWIATAGSILGALLLTGSISGIGAYEWLILLMLGIPWVAVGLTWYYKGILRVYFCMNGPYPSLSLMILLTELAAFVEVLGTFGIYEYDKKFWLSLIVLSLLVFLVWAVACRSAIAEETNRVGMWATLILAVVFFSFSALVFTNCNYDRSTPRIWKAAVKSKYVSHDRYNTKYSLNLSSWGRFADGESVQVPSSFYHGVRRGDSVNVYLKAGTWGIPWYQVAKD